MTDEEKKAGIEKIKSDIIEEVRAMDKEYQFPLKVVPIGRRYGRALRSLGTSVQELLAEIDKEGKVLVVVHNKTGARFLMLPENVQTCKESDIGDLGLQRYLGIVQDTLNKY